MQQSQYAVIKLEKGQKRNCVEWPSYNGLTSPNCSLDYRNKEVCFLKENRVLKNCTFKEKFSQS